MARCSRSSKRINHIRRDNVALQELTNVTFLDTANDALIAYAKQSRGNAVITVVSIDPHQVQEGLAIVPANLGLPPSFTAHDLLTDERYQWRIGPNYVRLEPGYRQAHIVRVEMLMSAGPPTLTHLIARERSQMITTPPPHEPTTGTEAQARQWFEAEPLWFKSAVFYEIHIRGFFDANGDGSGDFRGLTEKLDYLQWLGIDCIWLLPFYRSPLRDGGYDIADFTSVHPDYGNVDDVHDLIDAAHARRIRVIADLVMNHTSSEHPWFQESRSSPDSPKRDWYVWSDTNERYPDARIIFIDTETSNWSWDPVAGAYYWHRFFSYQPDLNYDNPEVREAMIEVLRFWLDLGLDGFRLDAVPYLYERDGTICENLPETHAYLKRVRKEVDERYPDRVLLAEANQWPADVVQYFGDGDECQMAFHFPVMPRMFMAIRREEAVPIYEILEQTPLIPDSCQWGLFLRNHDELTLEMVTDEERDYMYSEYAKDPRMKINVGIRRRLAPLLDNGRDEIELMTRDHVLAARLAGPLLRRRDRDGRQRVPRRPRRRAHADAVDRRPQRRLLARGLRPAVRAAADGPGVRLPGGQRRGSAAHRYLAAALAAPVHRAAQGAPRVRLRNIRADRALQSAHLRASALFRG